MFEDKDKKQENDDRWTPPKVGSKHFQIIQDGESRFVEVDSDGHIQIKTNY